MTIVQEQASLSSDEILKAVEKLSPPELEALAESVLALREQRRRQATPVLTAEEQAALTQIAKQLSAEERRRYEKLGTKRRAETLTDGEHEELIRLSEKIEQAEVARLECLAELASKREMSLVEFLRAFGLRAPSYA
jgi:hypothetical protein